MNNPGKWEFPGGKREAGESHESCLKREIWEELEVEIIITHALQGVNHQYPDRHIQLIPFICFISGGVIQLKEHQNSAWICNEDFSKYNCSEADIKVWNQYLEAKKKP